MAVTPLETIDEWGKIELTGDVLAELHSSGSLRSDSQGRNRSDGSTPRFPSFASSMHFSATADAIVENAFGRE
jgi:hypothetical protein